MSLGLDMCTPTPTIPTFITEVLHLFACVQPFKRNVKVKITAYTTNLKLTLIRLVSVTRFNSKAMPITNNDYSCHYFHTPGQLL